MATKKKTKKKQTKSKKVAAKKVTPKKNKLKPAKKNLAKKKAAPKKAAPKKRAAVRKTTAAKKAPASTKQARRNTASNEEELTFSLGQPVSRSGGLSGDLQGLPRLESADSESVDDLVEEGNAFEADAVMGVERAGDEEGREVHTREAPEDDVPEEYLGKDQ
jgi:hypothetical protein